MSESSKDRFDTLSDEELADHVVSGHVDPVAGEEELARRKKDAEKPAPKPAEAPKRSGDGK